MVLSNAERQARYRQSIKARANDPGAAARAAADAASACIWDLFRRTGEASTIERPQFPAWRTEYLGDGLVETCRALIDDPSFTPDEAAAVRTVVAIDDALKLKHP